MTVALLHCIIFTSHSLLERLGDLGLLNLRPDQEMGAHGYMAPLRLSSSV